MILIFLWRLLISSLLISRFGSENFNIKIAQFSILRSNICLILFNLMFWLNQLTNVLKVIGLF